MVCMECYKGKKVVNMEGCLMVTPYCEWIHSWCGVITCVLWD